MRFLHKIKVVFQRMFACNNIDFVSEQKAYGNEADFIYSLSMFGDRSCHCLIDNSSISNICNGIEANIISKITVSHRFSYDNVYIYMQNGQTATARIENGTMLATDTRGNCNQYNLCKIETIILEKRQR